MKTMNRLSRSYFGNKLYNMYLLTLTLTEHEFELNTHEVLYMYIIINDYRLAKVNSKRNCVLTQY